MYSRCTSLYVYSVCVVMVCVEVGGRWIDVLIGRQCLQCRFQTMLSSNLVVIRLHSTRVVCVCVCVCTVCVVDIDRVSAVCMLERFLLSSVLNTHNLKECVGDEATLGTTRPHPVVMAVGHSLLLHVQSVHSPVLFLSA